MNTGKVYKRILIYGDSLVFGKVGGKNERFLAEDRLTGILQSTLGPDVEIIESGLRGRMLSGENYFFAERDGLMQFGPTIGSQLPVDFIVIILGSNDANAKGDKNEEQIFQTLNKYMEKLKEWVQFLDVKTPEIIIGIPPKIDTSSYDDGARAIFGEDAPKKLSLIQDSIRSWCISNSISHLEMSKVCDPGKGDGIHLDRIGNQKVAKALAELIG
jgi:lysophospholipase L1-like esterase